MKAKTFNKKLDLHKETIVDLTKKELEAVKGGATLQGSFCPDRTCDTRCKTFLC
jgi:hypothetical protein